ncbi:amidophosphoribosyltransferase [Thermosporothrix hazakensis]|jgi:amidophosphoribosyltransferase|uniref:Amidophosphoribosyltransferase n=2 Tax=Thermosporothrix TaxID=768650 RepID=A0A326U016_THEHA|nr:amidophosphoribosyltransferase [Thermosporothrix hazakensis]PZW23432.1 amidophosphoribosyltransferase [Thermosporothrix hazakensis]BBH89778.1 amidophosphoribosyltransferase [Thermosporothrix sp. COM3]GCE47967.1 amidophosphoribosyltransferase [Thermosporothrix hazakensis]
MERLHEACGVVGIYTPQDNASLDVRRYLTLALSALQHRGQESAGMAVYNEDGTISHRVGMGKVREVFPDSGTNLPWSRCGIGHVRYSTTGSSCVENAGPFVVGGRAESIAIAHNGDLVNAATLRNAFPPEALSSTTDSEVIAWLLLSVEGKTFRDRMYEVMQMLRGSFSLVILANGKLYATRDPWGLRPLCIGRLGNGWIVASESCALDRTGATFVRKVEPGELITIDENGIQSEMLIDLPTHSLCVFEYIYFSDATSRLNDRYTYFVREALGRELAREHPVEADLVVPVPDSSIPSALGYAEVSGIPYSQAIIKNRYSDRSFIKPDQRLRQLEVDLKFNFVRPKIEGARLIIVDDSIVRGNTVKRLASALRNYGAKEIHLRISSPPLRHPCYFGIDIPRDTELIAAGRSIQEVADYIGVESLGYLSLPGLGRAIHSAGAHAYELNDQEGIELLNREFCYGCMEKQGWPFDPQIERKHGPAPLSFVPRDAIIKGKK